MDDKPAKQTARKMLQMVFDMNKANFGGKTVVTTSPDLFWVRSAPARQ